MGAKTNLLIYLDIINEKKSDFYLKTGLSNGFLDKNENISSNNIEIIISKYPHLNVDWLITGRGDMLRNIEEVSKEYVKKGIPLIPIEAVAGLPSVDNLGVIFHDCDQYIVPEFKDKGVEFMIRVSGSSMYPKYSNGDILACRRIHDILFFQWGKIYVIDSSQGALVKRVYEDKDNPDNIICVSENKERYPAFSIPKNDIRSLSIVIGVIRLE